VGKTNDRRICGGLTPLIYNHVNPYDLFLLNMNERLLGEEEVAA
jgi:hypothetical protein